MDALKRTLVLRGTYYGLYPVYTNCSAYKEKRFINMYHYYIYTPTILLAMFNKVNL